MQRRGSRALLLVHHANKKGEQRGTNQREDMLDLVMAIRRPADYQPAEGARFEIHFEKARCLFGEAAKPIEARLQVDPPGVARWDWRALHHNDFDRVVELLKARAERAPGRARTRHLKKPELSPALSPPDSCSAIRYAAPLSKR
jgi:hypothetical protein